MSKETLNAETFLNDNLSTNINEISGKEIIEFMQEFAEAYHKAKVNAITEMDIIDRQLELTDDYSIDYNSDTGKVFRMGIDWFKNRLLNGK